MCLQLIFTNSGEPFAQLLISDLSFPWVTRKYADCLEDHGLVQLITHPTNVLDWFITNNDSLIIKT